MNIRSKTKTEYVKQANIEHNGIVHMFIAVDDIKYVTEINNDGKEIYLNPIKAISVDFTNKNRLPSIRMAIHSEVSQLQYE